MKTHRSIHTAAYKYLKHKIYSKFVQLFSIETCWRSDWEIDTISLISMQFMHAKQRTLINIGKIVGAVKLLTCSCQCKVLGLHLQACDNIVWYTARDSSLRFYFECFNSTVCYINCARVPEIYQALRAMPQYCLGRRLSRWRIMAPAQKTNSQNRVKYECDYIMKWLMNSSSCIR